MWTVSLVLYLGGLHCAVCSTPSSPINVTFSSVNLRNILQWSPGNGTPDNTHFTVQYTIYGDSVNGSKGNVNWRKVRQCTRIARSWCDLSNETIDLEEGYYARVRAVSKNASSKWTVTPRRFDPKTDTSFGPPLVSVVIEDNSAIITLKGPMRYQPNNPTPGVSMSTLYPTMTYNLSIHNTRRDQTSHFQLVSGAYKYRLMEYDTDYCFSAKARFLSMPVHCLSSEWQCITTPPDPVTGQLKSVVVSIVVPFVCMCTLMVVGYLLYQYLTGKGQKSPIILNLPSFHPPPLIIPPENYTFFVKPSDIGISDPACPYQWPHNADPPPRYAPQRSETPEAEEPQDELSIDYAGFLGVAPKISVRGEEERERRHNGGEDGSTLNLAECHCTGVYASQQPNIWQKSTHTFSQTHMPMHTQTREQTETSTLVQARVFSEANSVRLTQTQAPLLATKGEVDRKREGSESEEVPLLSAYASQNISGMLPFDTDQSDSLPDDYGVLRLVKEEEEEGPICINWDPKTGKLVLPEMSMEFNKEGGLDGCMQGERERENRAGGEEEEEEYVMRGELRLENVIVRQTSEEASETQTEMTRAVETGWESDEITTKWNLKISMDQ